MTAPDKIWVGTEYGKTVGVDWSVERAFEKDVEYTRVASVPKLDAIVIAKAAEIAANYIHLGI